MKFEVISIAIRVLLIQYLKYFSDSVRECAYVNEFWTDLGCFFPPEQQRTSETSAEETREAIQKFTDDLHRKINPKNLKMFVDAYLK